MSVKAPVRAPSSSRKPSGFSPRGIVKTVSDAVNRVKDTAKNIANKFQAEFHKDTFEKGPLAPHIKKMLEGFPGLHKPASETGDTSKSGQTSGTQCKPDLPCEPNANPIMAENLLYRPGEHQVEMNQVGTIKRPVAPVITKGIKPPTIWT